jgi:hypothetical protein
LDGIVELKNRSDYEVAFIQRDVSLLQELSNEECMDYIVANLIKIQMYNVDNTLSEMKEAIERYDKLSDEYSLRAPIDNDTASDYTAMAQTYTQHQIDTIYNATNQNTVLANN